MDNNDNHEFEWNDIYTGESSDYLEPDSLLLEIIEDLAPGRALDIGCGAGGLIVALVERGWSAAGIDIAPNAIESARHVLEERGLDAELAVADAAQWTSSEQYDLITNSFALPGTAREQAALFATMRRILAPGGSILIKDFDAGMKWNSAFSQFHCPTVDELRAAFEGLEIARAEVVETEAHSGAPESDPTWTAALLHARSVDGS